MRVRCRSGERGGTVSVFLGGTAKGRTGTFFDTRAGSRGSMSEPCLVAPRLIWNCRTSLRTSAWSVSTCLRGRRSTLDCTLGASHLNEIGRGRAYEGQGEGGGMMFGG